MDVQSLRWFQLVADGATVTEVAELHMVSQPGVSRALARLEQEVGSPLLLRSGRLLRTTHAGAVFKRHVDAAMHSFDDGLAAVEQLIDPETGSVSIVFQLSLGAWLVPDLVDTFRRDHPRVRFRLNSSDDARGSMVLADSHLDLELTARRPTEEGVSWEYLFTQPLVLAVSLEHRLADRTEVHLEEVADDDFVMLRPSWELRVQTDGLCRDGRLHAPIGLRGRRPGRRPRLRRGRARGGRGAGRRVLAGGDPRARAAPAARSTRARTARSAWPGSRSAGCCPRPSCSVAT